MAIPPLCRWGILGSANIARKNWKAIHNSGNSTLVAVASRDRARAQKFIDECQCEAPFKTSPVACGSYEELLGRKDIDAVYIPLPTGIRKEWVLQTAAAGKHVLCEKPCGVNSDEVRAMIEACQKHRVQFMDGVMFMHSRRLPLLRQVLDDDHSIGEIRRITSSFSFLGHTEFMTKNIRVSAELEPLGCLGDLGWYNIRFSLWTMKGVTPNKVSGRLLSQYGRPDSRELVPTEFSGELFFPDGVSASFYCSFVTHNQQWANVSGTNGYLRLDDFVVPFFSSSVGFDANAPTLNVRGCDFNMESHPRHFSVHEYSNAAPTSQETNMIRTFGSIVLNGQLDPSWGEWALKTQVVLEACLKSATEGGKLVAIA
jgi:predicted dehydrogenase